MRDTSFTREWPLQVFNKNTLRDSYDNLVVEQMIHIVVNGEALVSLASSPEAYKELAIGYLIDEGLIHYPSDIKEITVDEQKLSVQVKVAPKAFSAPSGQYLHSAMGKSSTYNELPAIGGENVHFQAEQLLKLIHELEASSTTFKETGGVHSAALGDQSGLCIRYEDIGRHNAVDKVLGHAFLNKISTKDKCLVLSGRIASEILLKAARNGIPVVVSRAAPTHKAVELADEIGITVVGFARGQRFNLYTHKYRVQVG